jgi:hypothetical protein
VRGLSRRCRMVHAQTPGATPTSFSRKGRTGASPPLASISGVVEGEVSKSRNAWLATQADRTRLRSNSLLTGNFTGNFVIPGVWQPPLSVETAVLQGLFRLFPAQINREILSRNREFWCRNREFHLATQRCDGNWLAFSAARTKGVVASTLGNSVVTRPRHRGLAGRGGRGQCPR